MKLIKNAPVLIASTANMNVILDKVYPVQVFNNTPTVPNKYQKKARVLELLTRRDLNYVNMYLPVTKTGVNKVLLYMKMRRQRRAERQKAYQLRQASVAVA